MAVRILVGHVLHRLRGLPAESVHCVVTSPPYYGLRDYGIEPQVWGDGCRGSLGLEPTMALYLDHMVEVFREVRRVMRKDATCWLNIGDSYASGTKGDKRTNAQERPRDANGFHSGSGVRWNTGSTWKIEHGLKPKDLMLIPSRLAIRLQDDGWWVRSDIAWCKRAPMPESCTDRPTSAWEHVFLLTKSARYYYDAEAVKELADGDTHSKGNKLDPPMEHAGVGHIGWTKATKDMPSTHRNQRNVWLLGPEPFPEAHFATFPTEIPRRAILAGTSERGVCPKCAAPWERMVAKERRFESGSGRAGHMPTGKNGENLQGGGATLDIRRGPCVDVETLGWRPTCGCDAGEPVSATVLDPFLGAGTTALVADRLGRDCIGIELNPEYAAMARRRIEGDGPLLAEVAD